MAATKRAVLVPLLAAAVIVGCSQSAPQDKRTVSRDTQRLNKPTSSPTHEQQKAREANAKLAQNVALARVHLKHREYEEAEKILSEALNDRDATDKRDAIVLFDEVKTKIEQSRDTGLPASDAPKPTEKPAARLSRSKSQKQTLDTGSQQTKVARHQEAVQPGRQTEAPSTGSSNGSQDPATKVDAPDSPHKTALRDKPPTAEVTSTSRRVPGVEQQALDEPIKKVPAEDADIRRLEQAAKKAKTAKEALDLYRQFLALHTLSPAQKERVDADRSNWKSKADQGLVRLGRKWVTEEDAQAAAMQADNLIAQALELVEVGDFDQAGDLLRDASRVDPAGIRADYILGLFNSPLAFNHPRTAEKHFEIVLDRFPNHIAALNNVALIEVRLRQFGAALNHWKKALELAPKTPEVTHNIGRFISEATQKKLDVPRSLLSKFSRLYAEAVATHRGTSSDPNVGWLYVALVLPNDERQREQKSKRVHENAQLTATAWGTGFVVGTNYILTNRHVVKDATFGAADAFAVVDPADSKHERELNAELVAASNDSDLALLKCDQLQSKPIGLAGRSPRLGEEIMVLGYPMGDAFGRNLKSTKGAISGLPDPDTDNFLVYDATTNPGNSGGPVCDQYGQVIAVHTTGYLFSGKLAGGVPSKTAATFLKTQLPHLEPDKKSDKMIAWPDVVEKVSNSTVMIITYHKAVSLGIDKASDGSAPRRNYLEDVTCNVCGGSAKMPCPADKCIRGRISVKTYKTVTVIAQNGHCDRAGARRKKARKKALHH